MLRLLLLLLLLLASPLALSYFRRYCSPYPFYSSSLLYKKVLVTMSALPLPVPLLIVTSTANFPFIRSSRHVLITSTSATFIRAAADKPTAAMHNKQQRPRERSYRSYCVIISTRRPNCTIDYRLYYDFVLLFRYRFFCYLSSLFGAGCR